MIDNEDWLLEKVIEYFPGRFKRTKHGINGKCPMCGDSKKSKTKMRFHYYARTKSAYCFNCSESWSALTLLKHLSGEDYQSLKRKYIREAFRNGPTKPTVIKRDDGVDDLKCIIPEDWKKPLSDRAHEYLEKRMIFDAPFISDTRFYTCIDKHNQEFILIPWKIKNVEVYYQINDYLKHGERKYIFPYNQTKKIFGLDNVDRSFKYIICFEGVYDSLFVKNGIAIGGKSITANQKTMLKKMFPYHKIVMGLDNDDAGKSAVAKIIDEDPSTLFFDWATKFPGHKDINDLVINTNRSDLLSDVAVVESMIYSSLYAKMQMKKWSS